MKLKTWFQVFGAIAILLTLFPFIAVDYWWIRIFDFPHLQLTILTFAAILSYFIKFSINRISDYLFVVVLTSCFIFQFSKIVPFTPLASYEVLESTKQSKNTTIRIFTANVLQENEQFEKLFKEINNLDPDIIVLTETNHRWKEAVSKELTPDYTYTAGVPLENTYGMLLYSKFELLNPEVKFLVDDSIPSIHSKIVLPSKDLIQLFAIHPTPPMPQHNPYSTDRDAEMMKIALKSLDAELPVIVMGDFNDVSWSQSTLLFQEISGLLDMRKGRGIFNTYHAKNFITRWPLDHIFISEEFRVVELRCGNKIGSDHFPTYAQISFEPEGADEQRMPPPDADQIERAREQIKAEKSTQ